MQDRLNQSSKNDDSDAVVESLEH